MKRAERRAQIERLKKRRRAYYNRPTSDPAELGRRVHTMPACSCWMCGNPRRRGELPMNERRAAALWLEAFADWNRPEVDAAWAHVQEGR